MGLAGNGNNHKHLKVFNPAPHSYLEERLFINPVLGSQWYGLWWGDPDQPDLQRPEVRLMLAFLERLMLDAASGRWTQDIQRWLTQPGSLISPGMVACILKVPVGRIRELVRGALIMPIPTKEIPLTLKPASWRQLMNGQVVYVRRHGKLTRATIREFGRSRGDMTVVRLWLDNGRSTRHYAKQLLIEAR